MNKKTVTKAVLFSTMLILFIFFMYTGFNKDSKITYKLYNVYLEGKKIGTIEKDEELYALIDNEQQAIKEEYGVSKIYPPKTLEVSPVFTYDPNIISSRELYEQIKDIDPFTIEGFEVVIQKEVPIKFYVLNERDLDESVKNIITSFVKADDYIKYLEGTQPKEIDEGVLLSNVTLGSEMTTKKVYVSTEDEILTNSDDITRFLLFGSVEPQKHYTVKADDTIDTIAWKNQMSVKDFLIANPEIISEKALLSAGQVVNVGEVNPINDIVVDAIETEKQVIKYETKIEYDKNLDSSSQYVKVEGSNGLAKVEFATRTVNGVTLKAVRGGVEELVPVIDKVIVMGAHSIHYIGNSNWAWPTSKPYKISDYYGYRIDPFTRKPKLHTGVDITGVGQKDGIYAINDGKVTSVGYSSSMGRYVIINHGGGYVSQYLHLSKQLAKVGDEVVKGQQIGVMGSTGRSTGKHLHLSVLYEGKHINPMNLYQ